MNWITENQNRNQIAAINFIVRKIAKTGFCFGSGKNFIGGGVMQRLTEYYEGEARAIRIDHKKAFAKLAAYEDTDRNGVALWNLTTNNL